MKAKVKTLIFLVDTKSGKVGLSTKKYGPAKGWYNGYGGKVEYGEDIKLGALRELEEECDVEAEPKDLIFVGKVLFEFPSLKEDALVYVFVLTSRKGEPQESKEMTAPEWFALDKLPYEKMWDGDKIWVPLVLNKQNLKNNFEQKIFGRFVFDKDFKIETWEIVKSD